jgi:hypothetical protein
MTDAIRKPKKFNPPQEDAYPKSSTFLNSLKSTIASGPMGGTPMVSRPGK